MRFLAQMRIHVEYGHDSPRCRAVALRLAHAAFCTARQGVVPLFDRQTDLGQVREWDLCLRAVAGSFRPRDKRYP